MKKTGLVMASIMGVVLLLGIFGYSLVAAEQESASSNDSGNSGSSSQIEIEVKIVNGVAYVKTHVNGVEDQFLLNTTDTNTIISGIATRTGLTVQQVQDNIQFHTENETESDVQSSSHETESEHESEIEQDSDSHDLNESESSEDSSS